MNDIKNMNLTKRMANKLPSMSKGQKKLVNYITLHYSKAVFMTAAKLGNEVGVSESTVVRFATLLGYKGYPQFQRALEEMVQEKLDSIEKIDISSKNMSRQEILESVLKADMEKLKLTLDTIDRDAFESAVETILQSKKIYIVGIRSCAPLAVFLGFYLNLMFDDVAVVSTNSASEMFEQMIRITEDDCVIGISFPRYSMRTLKAMEFANNRSARVITITDCKHSPMNLYSSCNLLARSDMSSVVDSLVAPLSVINALIVALCVKKQKKVMDTLSMLENVWDEYQIYSKDEINMVNDLENDIINLEDDV